MFELSDDEDESFWNDIPLHGVSIEKDENKNSVAVKKPQLRVPESSCVGQPAKKLCTEKRFVREPIEALNNINSEIHSKGNQARTTASHRQDSISPEIEFSRSSDRSITPGMLKDRHIATSPLDVLHTRGRSLTEAQNTPNTSHDVSVDYITPKRKRKFPGPAGVLPKLTPGQSLDIGIHTSTPEILTKENKSPQEDMVLSSQSSENLFMDDPWQALLKDIGEQGLSIMRKFSIASTLLKAGKKQLQQGKAWLVFGIIESIENRGSEASASIKDRSGNMHGTIHTDLMTEYEMELQVGTVLVLKQVSIISLSNKNHYLNITPNNLVSLYHIKENTLKALHFHGSQDSLHSVLKVLERESTVRRQDSTPGSSRGSSRLSVDGSGTNTPVLSTGTPDVQSLTKRLFNTHSPGTRVQSLPGVRDVSVVHRQSIGNTNYTNTSNIVPVRQPVRNTNYTNNTDISPAKQPVRNSTYTKTHDVVPSRHYNNFANNSMNEVRGNAIKYSANQASVSSTSLNTCNRTPQQTSSSYTNTAAKSVTDSTPEVSVKSKWKFRSPSSSVTSSPNITVNPGNNSSARDTCLTPNHHVSSDSRSSTSVQSGRACQLQVPSTTGSVCRTSTSHAMRGHVGMNTKSQVKSSNQEDHADLWEDDLTDEILSQMGYSLT